MKTRNGWLALGAVGIAIMAACGGVAGNKQAESNTNWMRSCDSDADCGALSCECGVCSRECDSAADCSDLATLASCEPGESGSCAVNVCIPPAFPGSDAGSGGATATGGQPSSTGGQPPNTGGAGNDAGGAGGETACLPEDDGCVVVSEAIVPCPGGIEAEAPQTDPLLIDALTLDGDTLEIVVSYSGGCAAHEFSLCYVQGLGLSDPAYAGGYVLHEDNGDDCDGSLETTLTFDLSPLADYVWPEGGLVRFDAWSRDDTGKAVSGGEVLYHWGELGCYDRVHLATSEVQAAATQADRSCSTAADCQRVSADTACSVTCGAIVSTSGASAFNAALEGIDSAVCGDFDGDGCEAPEPAVCLTEPPLDCVNGTCGSSEL